MLDFQFVNIANLNMGDLTSLELSCMFDIINTLNDLYGYNDSAFLE